MEPECISTQLYATFRLSQRTFGWLQLCIWTLVWGGVGI